MDTQLKPSIRFSTISLCTRSFIMGAVMISTAFVGSMANAELIIHTSQDDTGRTQMLVEQEETETLPPAQLGITPPRIDETVSIAQSKNLSGLNQSLTLYNYSNKPKKITLNFVDIDETGSAIAPSETTLKPWVLLNPTDFTIAPNSYQTVRLSMRLPLSFAKGTHLAMLTIKQQVDNSLTYDADGKGVTVELGSRYGLPVRIDVE